MGKISRSHWGISLISLCIVFGQLMDSCRTERTNVGLIYENTNPDLEKIFHLAIDKANEENEELKLHGVAVAIEPNNAFETSKKLCKMLRQNLVAVFGPSTNLAARHAMSICDAKELPFLDTRWDFAAQLPTINLHPHPAQLGVALMDLVSALGWESFTIIYESGEYLATVNDLLQMYGTTGPTITLRRYDLDLNGNYRNVLRRIRNAEDDSFVVVGSMDTLPEFFKQAQQVGLMTSDYRYIIGNLDWHTMDLEPYQHADANITGMRVVSPQNEQVLEVAKALYASEEPFQNVSCPVTNSMALIYDGIQLLAETHKHINFRPIQLSCADDSTWDKGYTFVNYMKQLTLNGLTGTIRFDNEGLRTDFQLEVIELSVSGLLPIGQWSTENGFEMNRPAATHTLEPDMRSLMNKSFVVVTAISEPYGMLKETAEKQEGNAQFEGFGIELIDELSKKLGFTYTFYLQPDNKYGGLDPKTGEWNGMLREIIDNRADMGITDLTMTSERESGVDFTIPFMNLGIAILFRKPMKEPPKLFSFMSPFSGEVWLWLGLAYMGVSISMFILGRLSPAEWDNPYPCIEEPTELENQFSFANCLWFSIGALLQQGSELAPKAFSTRAVASSWWFFTLILVSSYTANLAAFLTVESLVTPIEDADDLSQNKGGVNYGAKIGGSTFTFFKDAKYPTYQKMFEFMDQNPQYMTNSNQEGVDRVENSNYAFLMESTTIEYITERRCTLTQVGTLLDEKGYGIAMRKNWPYRDVLSQAILEMQEQGLLTKMKTKWWKEKRGGGACSDAGDEGGALALEISNLGGVYLVLGVGAFFGVFVSLLEMLLGVKERSSENKVNFKDELLDELRFIMQCSGNTKAVKYPKNSGSSSSSSGSGDKSKEGSSMSVDSLPEDQSVVDVEAVKEKRAKK
ncbi:glutamate receptor ionotropic, kainate 2 isoform X1 [Drosophila sulfurigaster albostrigata]|uniref:glutamate receptor ionotropic, kainate 2 isoform X1 n=1 Tax=Drosophila sulfurigaster albostrigata TaxID=89887 RepID=UPI002D21D3F0|nr:glutamate receptor ionotropic, kainate 2 isoform X1 [Drosophila sulfurigaster albostrigata]XP_062125742.1 glutamate receptor ionotropic, kainate 2 isoform X1 [Drosophila sulfurigaster albostrigata]